MYVTGGVGIKYEWRATTDAEPDPEWRYICGFEYVRSFEPPISLAEIRQHISRDEWAPPYQNFWGYASIQVPDRIAEKLLSLRRKQPPPGPRPTPLWREIDPAAKKRRKRRKDTGVEVHPEVIRERTLKHEKLVVEFAKFLKQRGLKCYEHNFDLLTQ